MTNKHHILFLGEGENNLHVMAEAFGREAANGANRSISAAMTPPARNPTAEAVMDEVDIAMADLPLRSLLDVELFNFDLVVTIGRFDPDCRPNLPGMPPHLHWDVPDPIRSAAADRYVETLREAREIVAEKVRTLVASDLLKALSVTRRNFELILDNMVDGVMAHTAHRRIFFFNRAAESITGYRRDEILGQDCHEVFPGRFCGGDCEYCNGINRSHGRSVQEKDVVFTGKAGQKRNLKMSVLPLADEAGKGVGALISFKDNTELTQLKRRIKHHYNLDGLVGRDPKMLLLFDHIREVAAVDVPVIIEGESGTGKELVANAIHNLGKRANRPFVAINCGALPETILESELFGHVRGAFSGAVQNRKGRFELADGGTIFLDEVGELSPAMQVKLLRVLQEQQFEPVGGEHSIRVNVRVISATNRNLRAMMEKKKFRRDLFYRLCVVPIVVPPLRDRKLDIPVLLDHFLELTSRELERPAITPSTEVLDFLTRYPWPGNVRELHNAVEFAYVKCRNGEIGIEHLPPEIALHEDRRPVKPGPALKEKEKVLIALSKAEGNKKEAARILGVSRATLYRYLDLYNLK
jgi:sigma-54 dependent transcriptional regulator, acetoin dehydrogenase operon transcriptional activator AcoR